MLPLQRSGPMTDLQRTSKPSKSHHTPLLFILPICFFRMASAAFRGWIVRDFQTQLYKTCGMRSIVLVAYEDKDGNVRASM